MHFTCCTAALWPSPANNLTSPQPIQSQFAKSYHVRRTTELTRWSNTKSKKCKCYQQSTSSNARRLQCLKTIGHTEKCIERKIFVCICSTCFCFKKYIIPYYLHLERSQKYIKIFKNWGNKPSWCPELYSDSKVRMAHSIYITPPHVVAIHI